MTIVSASYNAQGALVSPSTTGRSPPTEVTAWREALLGQAGSKGEALVAPKIPERGAASGMKAADPPVGLEALSLNGIQIAQSASGSSRQVPAIKLNPQLRAIAGPPADATGRYTSKSVESVPQIATREELANAFAQQFKVPGTQIGILGEVHSAEAFDILNKTGLATLKAVGSSGRSVYVGVETPTNPTVDAALDKLNSGKMSGDAFLTIASKSLGGSNAAEVASTRESLQKIVVEGHDKGLKYLFWDKNRIQENGQETVKGNRDQGGATFLADQARKNPNAVFVVGAGFSHAQLNADLIPTGSTPGITKGTTLANLLVNKMGRSHVFSVQEDPVVVSASEVGGKSAAVHQFPNLIADYDRNSPVKVPGTDAAGRLTGAKLPTYDAIVPVIINGTRRP